MFEIQLLGQMKDKLFLFLLAVMLVLYGIPKHIVYLFVAIVLIIDYLFRMETAHVNAYYAYPPSYHLRRE
jgi:hypothetical protein